MKVFVGTSFLSVCLAAGALVACGKGSGDPTPDAAKNIDAAAARCGDGTCTTSEIGSCVADCGGGATCNNNGTCDTGEMNMTPACGDCPNDGMCNNNGTCEPGMGEDVTNCMADCTGSGACNMNGTCDAGEDMTCVDCLGGGLM
ncbi:MAG: hypothetical protein KBG15_17615, partial [Kofleriaceae bacterium]|nr:hypothetical protein [Kofleriaceae bacterium]